MNSNVKLMRVFSSLPFLPISLSSSSSSSSSLILLLSESPPSVDDETHTHTHTHTGEAGAMEEEVVLANVGLDRWPEDVSRPDARVRVLDLQVPCLRPCGPCCSVKLS